MALRKPTQEELNNPNIVYVDPKGNRYTKFPEGYSIVDDEQNIQLPELIVTKHINKLSERDTELNINRKIEIHKADEQARRKTPGTGTFVVTPVITTLAGIGGATVLPYLLPGTIGGNIIGTTALGEALNHAIKYGTGKTIGEHTVNAAHYLGIPQNKWTDFGIQLIGDTPAYLTGDIIGKTVANAGKTLGREALLQMALNNTFRNVSIKPTIKDVNDNLSEREKLLQQIRNLNSLIQGKDTFEVFKTPEYSEAKKLINQINKLQHPVDLPLNWSSKNWFASRPKGLEPTAEEIAEFEANIPEYLEIQKNAGENWLKMPDGSMWQGDPREWVMMLSKAYKDYINGSNFTIPMTHLMSDFKGDRVIEVPSTGAGRLWGNGFYAYINPTGKLNTSVSTTSSTYPIIAAEPQSTLVVNAKNPITLSYEDLTPNALDLSARHSTDRIGSFHNLLFKGSGPYLKNDIGIAPKGKAVIGFPNDQGIAYPSLKFITGNTGRFSKNLNSSLFRGFVYPIVGLYQLNKQTSNEND